MWLRGVDSTSVVASVLHGVPVPATAAMPEYTAGLPAARQGEGEDGLVAAPGDTSAQWT
jgi:hypothetical protein